MSVFVLIHGAWHGSWCWKRVRKELQARGHEVFTPALAGVGERSHLISPQIDLSTHIADVVNLIRWEQLSDVILCGHSYGGCVISGVADRIPDQVAALVYLDAFVFENGQSLLDGLPAEMRENLLADARETGDGWRVRPIPAEAFNVNPHDREWVNAQCTPQPLATFRQPLSLTGGIERVKNITYILADGWSPSPFSEFYDKAQTREWKLRKMPCGHDVMLDMPGELADELVAVSSRSAASPD